MRVRGERDGRAAGSGVAHADVLEAQCVDCGSALTVRATPTADALRSRVASSAQAGELALGPAA